MAAQFVSGTPAGLGSLAGIAAPSGDFTIDVPYDGQLVVRSQTVGSDPSIWLQTISAPGQATTAPQFRFVAGGRSAGGILEDTMTLFSYDSGTVESGLCRTGIPGIVGEESTWNHRSNAVVPVAWNGATTYGGGALVISGGDLWKAVAPVVGVAPVAPAWTDLGAWVVNTPIYLGQCGRAVIAPGTGSVANPAVVYCAALRDAGAIVCATISGNAAPDATLTSIQNIVITPNATPEVRRFTIQANANATAAVNVAWWIPTISNGFW